MPTTTFAAIRDGLITAIEALTPNSISGDRFRLLSEGGLTAWSLANPAACMRRFEVRNKFDWDGPLTFSNATEEKWATTAQIAVAYPLECAKYGPRGLHDLDDLLEEDWFQLRECTTLEYSNRSATSGGEGPWFANPQTTLFEQGVMLMLCEFRVHFFRSIS